MHCAPHHIYSKRIWPPHSSSVSCSVTNLQNWPRHECNLLSLRYCTIRVEYLVCLLNNIAFGACWQISISGSESVAFNQINFQGIYNVSSNSAFTTARCKNNSLISVGVYCLEISILGATHRINFPGRIDGPRLQPCTT